MKQIIDTTGSWNNHNSENYQLYLNAMLNSFNKQQ